MKLNIQLPKKTIEPILTLKKPINGLCVNYLLFTLDNSQNIKYVHTFKEYY